MDSFNGRDLDRVEAIFLRLADQIGRAAPLLTDRFKTQWTAQLTDWGAFVRAHEGDGPHDDVATLEAFEGAAHVWGNRLAEALRDASPGAIPGPPPGPPPPPPPEPRTNFGAGWLIAGGVLGLAIFLRRR